MFTCSKCERVLDDGQRAGRYRPCKDCMRAYKQGWVAANKNYVTEFIREWKRQNAKALNAKRRAQRKKDVDPDWRRQENVKQRAHRAANPERTAEHNRATKQRYGYYKEKRREWTRNNPRVLAWNAARRSRQNKGIAIFFRDELLAIYAACPYGWHVDHVHPLNGENFSGLHVPWNLQFLPAAENIRKRNRLDREPEIGQTIEAHSSSPAVEIGLTVV